MRAENQLRVAEAIAIHEAADIFPFDEEHLQALAEDIAANGLHVPIELYDGRVIDGRRRFKACAIAGVTPTYRTVNVADPVAYVVSLNLHRRHLTPSQLAMAASAARNYYDEQAKQRMSDGGRNKGKENLPDPVKDPGQARDAVGKIFGISGKSVDYATRVRTMGTSELVRAVEDGRVAVSTAAIHAADPPDLQREFVASSANRKYRATNGGGEFGAVSEKQNTPTEPSTDGEIRSRGVGVQKANEAVDCLRRIPKNDSLRARGFQIVTDWIRRNR